MSDGALGMNFSGKVNAHYDSLSLFVSKIKSKEPKDKISKVANSAFVNQKQTHNNESKNCDNHSAVVLRENLNGSPVDSKSEKLSDLKYPNQSLAGNLNEETISASINSFNAEDDSFLQMIAKISDVINASPDDSLPLATQIEKKFIGLQAANEEVESLIHNVLDEGINLKDLLEVARQNEKKGGIQDLHSNLGQLRSEGRLTKDGKPLTDEQFRQLLILTATYVAIQIKLGQINDQINQMENDKKGTEPEKETKTGNYQVNLDLAYRSKSKSESLLEFFAARQYFIRIRSIEIGIQLIQLQSEARAKKIKAEFIKRDVESNEKFHRILQETINYQTNTQDILKDDVKQKDLKERAISTNWNKTVQIHVNAYVSTLGVGKGRMKFSTISDRGVLAEADYIIKTYASQKQLSSPDR